MAAQESRSEETQARIITIALRAFARDGFAGAALADIVQEANITTGAVYHHFGDKKGLFQAVAEYLEQEILDEVAKAPSQDDLWGTFEANILATLEICSRPDIQRIVFQEAPNVIGPAKWREIEMQYAFGVMQSAIKSLANVNLIHAPDPDLTAQIILGAIIQAAHGVAISDNKTKALTDAKSIVKRIILALRIN